MAAKTLFMGTTEVATSKTAAEITTLLVSFGARSININYSEDARIEGLTFTLLVEGLPLSFSLPVRIEPIYKILMDRNRKTWISDREKATTLAQAERVAWRQTLRWIQAQLAFIETGMVQPHEVFLPYFVQPGGTQTMFEYFSGETLKQIAAPEKVQ